MKSKLSLILFSLLTLTCRSTSFDRERAIATALNDVNGIVNRADVAAASAIVERDRDAIVSIWRELTEIAAPSGHEAARAERVMQLLRAAGATDVTHDEAGNVVAIRRGSGGGATVVFDAHLDTIFPVGTPLTTRIENGRIYAPGVGDNTRNVVAMIAMMRAMNEANVTTRGDVIFLFSVEEETSFRGVNHYLAKNAGNIDRWVTLDGGFGNFMIGAIGIYWDRYYFLGPGGHTLAEPPPYSATLPAARAIARMYAIELPVDTQLNIGMMGAGDVFNAKATEAWFSVDIRSNDQQSLERLDRQVQSIIAEEAERVSMQTRTERESRRDVAALPGHRDSPMVMTAEAVFRAFGLMPGPASRASNHLSAALAAGVPGIATGSAPCSRGHSVEESCEIEPLFTGIKRNIVMAVALAEPQHRR